MGTVSPVTEPINQARIAQVDAARAASGEENTAAGALIKAAMRSNDPEIQQAIRNNTLSEWLFLNKDDPRVKKLEGNAKKAVER